MKTFFILQLDYLYFVYGTVFLLLGLTCFIISREERNRIAWQAMGLFGILHGFKEWLDVFNFDVSGSPHTLWLSSALGLVSFLFLAEFVRLNTPALAKRRWSRYVIAALCIPPAVAGMIAGCRVFDIAVRYTVGLPAVLATSWFLWNRRRAGNAGWLELRIVAVAMALYGLLTGLVVLPYHKFPASLINTQSFFQVAGFPAPLARTLCALIITGGLWRYYLRSIRSGVGRFTATIPYLLLGSVALVVVLGFALVNMLSAKVAELMRYEFMNSAATIAASIDPAVLNSLSGTPADNNSPAGRMLVRQLHAIRAVDNRIVRIYPLIVRDGTVRHTVSVGMKGGEDRAAAGTVCDEAPSEALAAFRSKSPQFAGEYTGCRGTAVSVYVPAAAGFADSARAVIGVDRSAADWKHAITYERFVPILASAGVETLVMLYFFLAWRYRRKTALLREAEETARQQLAQLRFKDQLIEKTESAILTFDTLGILSYVNPAAAAMLQYASAAEIVGRSIFVFCDSPAAMDEQLRRVCGIGQWRGEHEFIRQDGTRFWGYMVSTLIRGDEGAPLSIVATMIDMTDIKASEEALRESEEKFRTITSMACDGVILTDMDGCILFWNAAAARMTGYPVYEATGRMLNQLITGAQSSVLTGDADGSSGAAAPVPGRTIETEILRRDGGRIPVELSITGVQIKGRWYAAGIMRDVTHRRQVELAIKENEQNLASIFRAIPAIVAVTEIVSHTFIDVNDAFMEATGYRRDEIIGRTPYALDIGFRQENRAQIWNEFYEHGVIRNREAKFRLKATQEIDALISITGIALQGEKYALVQVQDISARKRAEEAVRHASDFLDKIINTVGDPLFVKDDQRRLVLVNNAFCELFGRKRGELVGQSGAAVFPSERLAALEANEDDVYRSGSEHNLMESIEVNGAEKLIMLKKTRYMDAAGNAFLVAVGRDITGLKQAEEALRLSEARYRHVIESANDVVWEVDENAAYTFVSPRVKEMLGCDPEELIGRTPFSFMSADDACRVREEFQVMAFKAAPFSGLRNINFHKDGRPVILETSGTPIIDVAGRLRGYRGMNRDITERVRAEERLTRINECFLKFGPDYDGNITRLTELFGSFLDARFAVYSRFDDKGAALVGKWPGDSVHCLENETMGTLCPQVVFDSGSELQLVPDCGALPVERQDYCVANYGIKTHIGKAVKFGGVNVGALCAGFTRDYQPRPQDMELINIIIAAISVEESRHRATQELELNNRMLTALRRELSEMNAVLETRVSNKTEQVEALLRQKNEFMNQLGHDLKTPLTPLVALLPMLRREMGTPDGRRMLDVCINNVQYMQALVFKALELFRIESGNLELNRDRLNLHAEIKAALDAHAVSVVKSCISVVNLVGEGLFVDADSLRLREVLSNLFENAMHYMPPKGSLHIDAMSRSGQVEVLVRDTGIGVAPEHLERIFEEFYKVDPSRHDRASVGLGLAICRKIVHLHGGSIWATSEGVGKGTTIHFTLPEAQPQPGQGNGASA